MLYAIKSDTLFFNRQTNRVDIEAFSYLYPLADAALIRKMEGAEITRERLDYVHEGAPERHARRSGVLRVPRRARRAKTSSPTSPTSSCSSKTSSGRSSPGIVNDSLVISVRNLGYSKNAGEFVAALLRRHRQRRRPPGDGQGGRADARVPREVRRARRPTTSARRLHELVAQFLHEAPPVEKRRETAGVKS